MEGYKKHKCIYCDYTSDQSHNVKRHVEKKHPKNSSTLVEVGDSEKNGVGDQLINTMTGSTEDKHTQCGGGVEEMEDNYDSELDVVDLENAILTNWNAFKRKLEMGKQIKRIVEEKKVPKVCLDKGQMQALKLHEEWICKYYK